MTLPAIYIGLHLLTLIFFFIKRNWADKYKKVLITAHLFFFSLLVLDIFVINLRGVWFDRLLVVAFLLTASMIFALYSRTLRTWQKLYFGFFLFYPMLAAATFLIDRIFFVLLAGPLLVTLTLPETKYQTKDYELREIAGAIAPVQLALVKKGLVTEKYLGASKDEQITYKDVTGLEIIRISGDSTLALVAVGDNKYEIVFQK